MTKAEIDALLSNIRACTLCVKDLADGPRPIIQFSVTASIVIIGQAPGTRVHASGIPWDDASGARLREWTGLAPDLFHDRAKVALVPMFAIRELGQAATCRRVPNAPAWHDKIMAGLPSDRLTLLVGGFAQERYLPATKRQSLTTRVAGYRDHLPAYIPLPHPSWRSTGWMKRNPWFERDLLPVLKNLVEQRK